MYEQIWHISTRPWCCAHGCCLSYLSSVCIYVDFRLTFTISLCRDWTAICKGAIILELRMFGLAPLLRSKRTLSTWFFFVAQCSGVFPEESITFNTMSEEGKQNETKQKQTKIIRCSDCTEKKVSGLGLCYCISLEKEKISWDAVHCVKWIKYCAEYTVLVRGSGEKPVNFLPITIQVFPHSRVTRFTSLLDSSFSYFILLCSCFFRGCTE